jgi:hypothetical protein
VRGSNGDPGPQSVSGRGRLHRASIARSRRWRLRRACGIASAARSANVGVLGRDRRAPALRLDGSWTVPHTGWIRCPLLRGPPWLRIAPTTQQSMAVTTPVSSWVQITPITQHAKAVPTFSVELCANNAHNSEVGISKRSRGPVWRGYRLLIGGTAYASGAPPTYRTAPPRRGGSGARNGGPSSCSTV